MALGSYVHQRVGDTVTVLEHLRKNAKIAIIDDEPSQFPVEYLQRSGLSIETIRSISLTDIDRLRQYNLILLDIVGVVDEDSRSGGLELLKRLKGSGGSPVVIAVSGKKFDPTMTEFFKLAEDQMKKPISERLCEEKILYNLEAELSPLKLAGLLDSIIGTVRLNHSQHRKLVTHVINCLEGRLDCSQLRERISRVSSALDSAELERIVVKLKAALELFNATETV